MPQGKKSRKKAADAVASRCAGCKTFLKSAGRGDKCPGCDKLYCKRCSSWKSKKKDGFVCCANNECPWPPRCLDCAFGTTFKVGVKANSERRKKGGSYNRKQGGERGISHVLLWEVQPTSVF